MRIHRTALAAAGCVLVPLNNRLFTGVATCNLFGDTSISATAQVDGVDIDDNHNPVLVTISQTTTTVTVTFPADTPHRLGATTDYIQIKGTGISSLDGCWPIAAVSSATVVTFTSTSNTVAAMPAYALPLKFIKSIISTAAVSKSTTATETYSSMPASAVVLNCTSYTAGTILLDVIQPGIEHGV